MARVWFVTGSARGLGRAMVEAILASGDIVVATARKPQSLADLVEKYGSDKILTAALDVSDVDRVNQVVKEAEQAFGRIDLVVNNAGYAEIVSVEDISPEAFRAQMDVNFFGVLNVSKAVLPIMRRQQSGHILQISSVGGRIASPGLAAYQSAKWAVGGFSTSLSQEVAPFGIKVTVIEPGAIMTDFINHAVDNGVITEPYQQTVGSTNLVKDRFSSTWPGPSKMANAILYISRVDDPPLRLLLGQDTIPFIKMATEALAASDEKWLNVTKLEV
ncbi:hypothetical protein FZEAL_8297 [Fusarium zealandicum]|uniref:Uncharacterized protein n=1 Tax=Fusarium zealandicum TaxID=1053134 RepID=A0A8H4UF33_9HYPO|nr:hypothetical protein FZEAL_8297 [Fusarium zealandicum]